VIPGWHRGFEAGTAKGEPIGRPAFLHGHRAPANRVLIEKDRAPLTPGMRVGDDMALSRGIEAFPPSAAAGRATVRTARRCRRAHYPMSCGAPTSRASSSSAMADTVIR
jgi:hypothetical protein